MAPPKRGPMAHGPRVHEKAKDFKGTWKRLLIHCRKYWFSMIVAVIAAMIGTIFTLLGPDKISNMTQVILEGVITGIDMNAVKRIGLTLVAFYICSMILSFIQHIIMSTITHKTSKSLRKSISEKINHLPMWYYNQTTRYEVGVRMNHAVADGYLVANVFRLLRWEAEGACKGEVTV